MNSLVSIIIPCYNAERWIAEAIDSALSQTYSSLEVIVIDDGSTDHSLEIIKGYGDRIRWETGVNQGQSVARNRGFSLSNGKYIQWLDADDYILPEKLENQVSYLEESEDDIIYGDWRYQYHEINGYTRLGNVNVPGYHKDILDALLSGVALTVMNCLVKRKIVERLNGYDEKLRAGEDVDFWIRAAISGAKFVYQPGCYSVYRTYGNSTVSTQNKKRLCNSFEIILEKSFNLLLSNNNLNKTSKKSLAKGHFLLVRYYLEFDKKLSFYHLKKVKQLAPDFKPDGHSIYEKAVRYLGFNWAGYLLIFKKNVTQIFIKIRFS
jgi:glycosyltransferase involved in cell wall biosynthesis